MIQAIKSEPALIAGAIGSIVALVVAFGVKLSATEVGAISAVVSAVLAVIVRSQVTPTGSPAPAAPAVAQPGPPA